MTAAQEKELREALAGLIRSDEDVRSALLDWARSNPHIVFKW
jgi:hypothetical protein